jgi:glycosyltransferase involved in cell wall biosynthesis
MTAVDGGGGRALAPAPKVSVFLLTYNHVAWIAEAIESALAQSAPFPVEILISDDGSTDGTREIVRDYARRHPESIRTFLPERNLGIAGVWLQAARRCRGEYVAILEGDDRWTSPTKLARQAALLDSRPDWTSCFHGATLFHEDGRFPPRPATPAFDRHVFDRDDVLRACFIPFLTVMFRRAVLADTPEWIFSFTWFDWLFHLHCAGHGRIGHFEEDLAAYRVHERGNWSSQDRSSQLEEDLRVYERLLDELPQRRALIERCMAHRRCQLAVEESGVPVEAPVLLAEEVGDMQPYFNGRPAAVLGTAAARTNELSRSLSGAMRELVRTAGDGPPPESHYAPRVAPRKPGAKRRLACVGAHGSIAGVEAAAGELDVVADRVWRDDWCRVLELEVDSAAEPPANEEEANKKMGALVEIVDVSLTEPRVAGLEGGFLDEPKPGAVVDAHALDVLGWALGEGAEAVAVEFSVGGRPFWRAPLGTDRPDLEQAFPGRGEARQAGFRTTLNLIGTPPEFELEVAAVLRDQRRLSLGAIAGRHRWRRDRSPAYAQLVSVVIPCFGQAHYLGDAIESVLAQSYPHLEVLVIDDESIDNASEIAARYPGVRCLRGENKGVAGARNFGLRSTNGDFLVFLDADDRLLPEAVELGIRALEGHPECAAAIGAHQRISHEGRPLPTHDQPAVERGQYAQLLLDNWAGFPARAIYRRSLFEHVRGFDAELQPAEDYALNLEVMRRFPVCSHEGLVAEHREHARNSSGDAASMLTQTLAAVRAQRPHLRGDSELPGTYREAKRRWRAYYGDLLVAQARQSLRERRLRDFLRESLLLARHRPSGLARLLSRRVAVA